MDIMELGAIGELVGGIAVVGSLLYVGLQIRQNSTWLRASVVDGASQWMASSHLFLASRENAELLAVLSTNADTDDPFSVARVGQLFAGVIRIQETAHYHFRQGHYPLEIWEGYRGHLQVLASSHLFDAWWTVRRDMFNPAFRAYVDEVRQNEKLDLARVVLQAEER